MPPAPVGSNRATPPASRADDDIQIDPGFRRPAAALTGPSPLDPLRDWLTDRAHWGRAGLAAVALLAFLFACGAALGGRRTRPVSVSTNQAGAEITLNGRRLEARTPATLHLTPGYHSLSFALPGYRTRSVAQVEVPVGDGPLTLDPYPLDLIVQLVRIGTEPAGASVSVDEGPATETTPAVLSVVPGARRFVLSKPGYDPRTVTIECREGDGVLDLGSFPLTPREQPVQFLTVPPGARVVVDGDELSQATPVEAGLTVGRHTLRFELEGHVARQTTLEVQPAETTLAYPTVTLERIRREVEVPVTSDPPGASVECRLADGSGPARTLTTPARLRADAEQTWVLTATAPGVAPVRREVTLGADGRNAPVHFDLRPPGRKRLRCGIELVYIPAGSVTIGREVTHAVARRSAPRVDPGALALRLDPPADVAEPGPIGLMLNPPATGARRPDEPLAPTPRPRLRVRRDDDGADEGPPHVVELPALYMATTETTQRVFELIMKYNPSYFLPGVVAGLTDTGEHPVERVPYFEILEFLRRLEDYEGLPRGCLRLPTEAEAERAARGPDGAGAALDRGALLSQAWLKENAGGKTRPVGRRQPNGWQLYDVIGNVDEVTSDWYGHDYYAESPTVDPKGPPPVRGKREKVVRGGSYQTAADEFRVTDRRSCSPTASDQRTVGFRVVMSVDRPAGEPSR